MSPADLDRIEAALGFPLPLEYRKVAMEFPFQAIGNDCIYWFSNTADEVIQETQHPLEDGDYNMTGWKQGYLAIGRSASGDINVLDTLSPGLPVLILDHETHNMEPTWPTFADFVKEWQEAPALIARQVNEASFAIAEQRARMARGLRVIALILLICMMTPFLLWVITKLFGNRNGIL